METLPDASEPGSVVLEIGGDVGAAAVYFDAALAGHEIEIRGSGEEWQGRHVAVLERRLPDGSVWAALFPGLVAGRYEVRVIGAGSGAPTLTFEVVGAQVLSVHWDPSSSA